MPLNKNQQYFKFNLEELKGKNNNILYGEILSFIRNGFSPASRDRHIADRILYINDSNLFDDLLELFIENKIFTLNEIDLLYRILESKGYTQKENTVIKALYCHIVLYHRMYFYVYNQNGSDAVPKLKYTIIDKNLHHNLDKKKLKIDISKLVLNQAKQNLKNENVMIDVDDKEKSKIEILEENLLKYGFNDLEKVKSKNTIQIIKTISEESIAYQIAFLDYLGFVKKLYSEFCKTNTELNKVLSKILSTTERTVRGNLNGLKNEKSNDRNRYTAYQHKEQVINNYNLLK